MLGYFEDVSAPRRLHQRSPGVSEYERLRNAHFYKSSIEKVGLCFGGPHSAARPVAVAKSRAIEGDNAVFLCSEINQTARFRNLQSCCRCRAAARVRFLSPARRSGDEHRAL